ncbi:hypothetical protein KR074_011570, partial [Drosophila pseudoananassae]
SVEMYKLGFCVILAMVLRTMSIENFDCTANGTAQECPTSCPKTCEFDPTFCFRDCGAPCVCKPGYIIDAAIPACVLQSDCPKHVKQVKKNNRINNFPCFGANRNCK